MNDHIVNTAEMVSGLSEEDRKLITAIELGIPPEEDVELVKALIEVEQKVLTGPVEYAVVQTFTPTVVGDENLPEAEQAALFKAAAGVPDLVEETFEPAHDNEDRTRVKRGRKMVYDLSKLEIGQSIEYKGSLPSGRVLASLKGKDLNRRFQAKEKANGAIFITRLSPK